MIDKNTLAAVNAARARLTKQGFRNMPQISTRNELHEDVAEQIAAIRAEERRLNR
jgi:hypothetical protein